MNNNVIHDKIMYVYVCVYVYVCYAITIYLLLARFCNKVVTLVHKLDCFNLISVYDDVPVVLALGSTYLVLI